MNITIKIKKNESTMELIEFLNSPINRNGLPYTTGEKCMPLTVWGAAIRTLSTSLQANHYSSNFRWIEEGGYFKFEETFQWDTLDIYLFARLTQKGGLLEGQKLYISYTATRWCNYCGYDEVSKGLHLASWRTEIDYPEHLSLISAGIDRIRRLKYSNIKSEKVSAPDHSLEVSERIYDGGFGINENPRSLTSLASGYVYNEKAAATIRYGSEAKESLGYELKCYYTLADTNTLSESFEWVSSSMEMLLMGQVQAQECTAGIDDAEHHNALSTVANRLMRNKAIKRMEAVYSARDDYKMSTFSKKKNLDEEEKYLKLDAEMTAAGYESTLMESK